MEQNFIDILVSPDDGSSLSYDAKSNTLVSELENLVYIIERGIPIILTGKAKKISKETQYHKKQNKTFHSIDHYKR